jgi:hypothetical protein
MDEYPLTFKNLSYRLVEYAEIRRPITERRVMNFDNKKEVLLCSVKEF